MTHDMTKLLKHIHEMRERLRQTAITEQSLVKELADSLKILDQQLLQDVRNLATGHQTRRGSILNALEDLADSIGMFRPQHDNALPRPIAQPAASLTQAAAQPIPQQIDYGQQYDGHQYAPTAGDWRQATKKLNIEDELAELLERQKFKN